MLRAAAQAILDCAGFIASIFVPQDATNFDFIQMCVALLMIIFVALAIWYLPQLFHRGNSHR
ncbi:hypothetical protein [Bartonella sp. LJL80]